MISNDLRAAIVQHLKADAAITGFVGDRVFGNVPESIEWPYILVRNVDFVPFEAECISGREQTLQVSVFSMGPAKTEVENLTDAVSFSLNGKPISLAKDSVILFNLVLGRILEDPEPNVLQGVLQFTAVIEHG